MGRTCTSPRRPTTSPRLSVADPAFQLCVARLVTHYWSHDHFLADGQLLRDAGRLAGIPGVLVHGRYDVSGPLDTAWHLHHAWPDSDLVVVDDAGHGGGSIAAAHVAATDRFADRR
jgi:proline iminopeptidase